LVDVEAGVVVVPVPWRLQQRSSSKVAGGV
jgi:hypothetical protein